MANTAALSIRFGRARFRGMGLLLVCALPMAAAARAEDTTKPPATPPAEPKSPAIGVGKATNAEQVRLINDKLAEKWQANKLKPSERCTDHEFVRRVSLDIIGRIATPKEITQFFKDGPEVRRARLIDRLVQSEEYAKNFANIWTVLLMTRSGATDPMRSV